MLSSREMEMESLVKFCPNYSDHIYSKEEEPNISNLILSFSSMALRIQTRSYSRDLSSRICIPEDICCLRQNSCCLKRSLGN